MECSAFSSPGHPTVFNIIFKYLILSYFRDEDISTVCDGLFAARP
jgi:hypothetical protein